MKNTDPQPTLHKVLDRAWRFLQAGVAEVGHPFGWPVLGTIGATGQNLRTVVLRRADKQRRELRCFTDVRAQKVADLQAAGEVRWLFYDPEGKLQLRLCGDSRIHVRDALAEQEWEAIPVASRLNYCTTEAPGTALQTPGSGLPENLMGDAPSMDDSEVGWINFAVIVSRIRSMDWLELHRCGHRRARFTWEAEQLTASWIVP